MLNIEKYKDDILNAEQADVTCSVHNRFLQLSHKSCTGNCRECKKNVMKWLLEEYKEDILTEKEKAYLSAVIKPFKNEVLNIQKKSNYYEWISIVMKNNETISLPFFEKETMYKGMEKNRKYTLEELGL